MITQNVYLKHVIRIVIYNVDNIEVERTKKAENMDENNSEEMQWESDNNAEEVSKERNGRKLNEWILEQKMPQEEIKVFTNVAKGRFKTMMLYGLDYNKKAMFQWVKWFQKEIIWYMSDEQKIETFGSAEPFITKSNRGKI